MGIILFKYPEKSKNYWRWCCYTILLNLRIACIAHSLHKILTSLTIRGVFSSGIVFNKLHKITTFYTESFNWTVYLSIFSQWILFLLQLVLDYVEDSIQKYQIIVVLRIAGSLQPNRALINLDFQVKSRDQKTPNLFLGSYGRRGAREGE